MNRLEILPPGREVGRYRIVDVLGEGGMAVVYRVVHEQLSSLHALKVVVVPSRSIMERLIREGRAQASIRHRNIVAVHDVIEVSGSPGLVMEYVSGPSLEQLITHVPLPIEAIDHLARGVIRGIGAAHEAGFVHRDLKPANVLVSIEEDGLIPKVADFGLVKDQSSTERRTRSGVFMGTPNYMAPEQIRDARSVDHRADLWAVGVLLYELLARQRAFEGEDMLDVFNRVAEADRPRLRRMGLDLPERMVRAVEACLIVDPDERVGDALELYRIWSGDVSDVALAPTLQTLIPELQDRASRLVSQAPIEASAPPAAQATFDAGVTLSPPPPTQLAEPPREPPEPSRGRSRWVVPLVALLLLSGVAAVGGGLFLGLGAWQLSKRPEPTPEIRPTPVAHQPAPQDQEVIPEATEPPEPPAPVATPPGHDEPPVRSDPSSPGSIRTQPAPGAPAGEGTGEASRGGGSPSTDPRAPVEAEGAEGAEGEGTGGEGQGAEGESAEGQGTEGEGAEGEGTGGEGTEGGSDSPGQVGEAHSPAPPRHARLQLTPDSARAVTLRRGGATYHAGDTLPPGTYGVWLKSSMHPTPTQVGQATLQAGQELLLRCSDQMGRCIDCSEHPERCPSRRP